MESTILRKKYTAPDAEKIYVKERYRVMSTSRIEDKEPEVTENIGANEGFFTFEDE